MKTLTAIRKMLRDKQTMRASTTIRRMLHGKQIFVPSYQRAYSWDVLKDDDKTNQSKQINVFLDDLNNHVKGELKSPYYFGHFLFRKQVNKDDRGKKYEIIDGQQRLTTIVIFLSALFSRLEDFRKTNENEKEIFKDMIKENSTYRFQTVEYDRQILNDYAVDKVRLDRQDLETVSARRIVDAFDFFKDKLEDKDEKYLTDMLNVVVSSTCTTHCVSDESEAIQMFIFQNDRGKKPSNLEIIKAEFMHKILLLGNEEIKGLLEVINKRFENIYKNISSIEHRIDEDEVLNCTLKVYFNSLWEAVTSGKIERMLKNKDDALKFIEEFTRALDENFRFLKQFFINDSKNNDDIYSLIQLGGLGIVLPFVLKVYKFNLNIDEKSKLCRAFESLILRHKVVRTRADITSRISEVFENFTKNNDTIEPIINVINSLKNANSKENYWLSYWNKENFEKNLYNYTNSATVKFILWKYENFLISQGNKGYKPIKYDQIDNPELEHIAPKNPKKPDDVASGYDKYNEDFINYYLECLGNYLLISKSHNCSIGNKPFEEKIRTYTHLEQQREISIIAGQEKHWGRKQIYYRREKIVKFVTANF